MKWGGPQKVKEGKLVQRLRGGDPLAGDADLAVAAGVGQDDVFGRVPDEASQDRASEAEAAMSESIHYSMRIEWSDEDQVFVVSLPEWGDLVHTHGTTYEEALQRGKELIEELVASRQEHGEPLPPPQMFASVYRTWREPGATASPARVGYGASER